LFLFQGCAQRGARSAARLDIPGAQVEQSSPQTRTLAVYEPWFGHPRHISVGYSSQDPVTINKQISAAQGMGISAFVVDWYGDREPFVDRSYSLMQSIAAQRDFRVAMMYDETEEDNGHVTDDTLAAFDKFHDAYLAAGAPGREAYLMYKGRPVIFIFPKSRGTDWNRVREQVNKWDQPPVLIDEYPPGAHGEAFDGFYAWINPGRKGWARDGSRWGEDYLQDFYTTMQAKYPNKIAVGTAWAGFDDSKASWGLGRHMSQRCGQTFADTVHLWQQYDPPDHPLPFLLIATWNDYEEGSAIERGLEKCR